MHPRHKSWKGSAFSGPNLKGKFLSKNLLHFYSVSEKSDFQNAVEAQKSEPILSAAGLNFPMDMTWEHLVQLREGWRFQIG